MKGGQRAALLITPEIHPGKQNDTINQDFCCFCRRTGVGHQILAHSRKLRLPFLGNVPSSLKPHRTKYLGEEVMFSSFTKKYCESFINASNKKKLVEIVLYICVSISSVPFNYF